MDTTNNFLLFMLLLMIFKLEHIKSVPTSKIVAKRAVSSSDLEKWESNYIPYELDPKLHRHKCLIKTAMFHITLQSCVIFQHKWRDAEIEFLKIEKSTTSCGANVGKPQFIAHHHFYRKWSDPIYVPSSKMRLADSCINFGTILHELMHVLGFTHEHQRSDRDQFIKINIENIENFDDRDFVKNEKSNERIYTEFDIDSITMYGPTKAQSDDPQILKTIKSKVPGKKVVTADDKTGLSALDVKAINDLYNCDEKVKSNEGFIWDKWNRFQTYVHDCRTEADKYLNRTLIYAFEKKFQNMNRKIN